MDRILQNHLIQFLRRTWHWWALVGLLAFVAMPFLFSGNQVLSSDLRGDGLVTPWIYDFTARELLEGRWPDLLTDFDYPIPLGFNPNARSPFATVPPMDAVLMAPAAWLFSWPGQWNMVLVFGMLINATGVVALARALGCRGPGMVVAAAVGACSGPIWIEALEGRTNCFFPGLTLLGLAAFIKVLPVGQTAPLLGRVLWGILGAGVGWFSFVIYPPGVVLWIPVGLALLARHVIARRLAGVRELFLPAILLVVAYVLSLPFLAEMQQSGWVMQEFSHDQCAPAGRVLSLEELFKRGAGESFRGIPLGFWLLASLVLIRRQGRWFWGLVLGWALFLALLSLGPCPAWSRAGGMGVTDALWGWPLGDTIWWLASYLHYYDRMAAAACLMLGVAGAVGVEHAWADRTRRSRIPILLIVGYSVFQILSIHHQTVQNPRVWKAVPSEAVAEVLEDAEPGAVVELPYDQRHQFLSVLQSSEHPRVNTVRPTRRSKESWRGKLPVALPGGREANRQVIEWFDQLGRGTAPSEAPTRNQIADVGIRWVFYDAERCKKEGPFVAETGCSPLILRALYDTLGDGRKLDSGLRVWEVAGGW